MSTMDNIVKIAKAANREGYHVMAGDPYKSIKLFGHTSPQIHIDANSLDHAREKIFYMLLDDTMTIVDDPIMKR
jgi:Pyruvate/2-oxoacid:ferredoxin oxidoreductase gamma subunit